MKKTIFSILSVIVIYAVLITSTNIYFKNLNTTKPIEKIESKEKVTRGLKQSLINKYGDEITGNSKYDHGAPDRDLLEEEMTEDRTYYRYVYDDSLTEEENQEQWIQLELKALEDYYKRISSNE